MSIQTLEADVLMCWFSKWNPDQRSDFGHLLVNLMASHQSDPPKMASKTMEEEMMVLMSRLSVEPDSLSDFGSQLKVFEKWFGRWRDHEKVAFVKCLSSDYPVFCHWIMTR